MKETAKSNGEIFNAELNADFCTLGIEIEHFKKIEGEIYWDFAEKLRMTSKDGKRRGGERGRVLVRCRRCVGGFHT